MEKLTINQWAEEDRPREKMMLLAGPKPLKREKSCTSKDIYEIFHPLLCDLAHEEFWVLLLNQASRIIDKSRISRGGIDQTTADVRSILREALIQRATQIALIHNHPSGSPRPSTDDQRLTQLVQKGAQTMNIRLIDHVIVTDGRMVVYKSYLRGSLY